MPIWHVFGPNFSDDSRSPAPDWGIYEGEKAAVIDWVTEEHPDFKMHLEGRKFPRAEIREIVPKKVTPEMVEELRAAQKEAALSAERLARASKGVL